MSNKKNRNKEKKAAKAEARAKAEAKTASRLSMPKYTDDGSSPWIQMIPLTFFTAVIIMIVRMYNYKRNMDQFYWSNNTTGELTDFFSYYKAIAILVCACIIILIVAYRLISKSWKFEDPYLYIPIGIVMLMTVISYAASDYKEFSLLGYNERFEGTLVWLAYMVVLVYAVNIVKGERNIKWIIYPVAAASVLLGLIGIMQATGHDPLSYPFVQKLITPNTIVDEATGVTYHQLIDYTAQQGSSMFEFKFQNGEIGQTVYNINYVSFYLTLLLPLFAIMFIRSVLRGKEEKIYKKIIWLACFALAFFNFIGSKSSGGLIGIAVSVLIAIIVLNKRLRDWWKPIAGVLAVCVIIMAATTNIWMSEWFGSFKSNDTSDSSETTTEQTTADAHVLKNFVTGKNSIKVYMDDMSFTIKIPKNNSLDISVIDDKGKEVKTTGSAKLGIYGFADKRFSYCYLVDLTDSKTDECDFAFTSDGSETFWGFRKTSDGIKYVNYFNKEVDMNVIPAVGFKNSQTFGSNRGYIWSRSLPLMKSTILIGHGADTFCLNFPQNDYVGKHNVGFYNDNSDLTVDKPHNMYINMAVCTGLISMLAFLALLIMYAVQSFRLYRKREYSSFADYAGLGIFLGVMGFAATGLVNDSTVSVMPIFFGLLGTGFAINIMLNKQQQTDISK